MPISHAARHICKGFLRHTSTNMTTQFQNESETRGTSDVKYLVFSGDGDDTDNDQRKTYSVDMGATSGFCTVQKLWIFVFLQALMLVILAVVIGVHINQTKAETEVRFEKLEGRLVNDTKNTSEEDQRKPAGVTYVRWGRNECPDTADLVYIGVAAGGKGGEVELEVIEHVGGGSNYLCLTRNPDFNQSVAEEQDTRSRIYGAEYRSKGAGPLNNYHFHDAPCALCQSQAGRTQSIMIPATTYCPTGWTREYSGYLAAARWNHPRTEYVCLDEDPETIPDTAEKMKFRSFFTLKLLVLKVYPLNM
ncbi:uncharacterized protein [Amphiura filiformis]|uniref:uncharacterized protein n=1 Tax=Amphiura filiformis TaxID=82378 RepID=UPI003B21AC2D